MYIIFNHTCTLSPSHQQPFRYGSRKCNLPTVNSDWTIDIIKSELTSVCTYIVTLNIHVHLPVLLWELDYGRRVSTKINQIQTYTHTHNSICNSNSLAIILIIN